MNVLQMTNVLKNITTDVLVIGAGPTGLMAANQLNRFGIDFLIIDEKNCPTEQSRALSLSARSLELYQQLSLSDKVLQQSSIINGFSFYSGGKRKADVWLTDIGKGLSDFFHPMNIFEQSKNETLLNENLISFGKNVLWNNKFISLQENAEGINVAIKNNQTEEIKTINAKYVIGCDGVRSSVRHQRNFTFEGGTYENKFFVADTAITWKFGDDKIIMAPSDKVFVAFFPMKGEKRYRVLGTLPLEFTDKEEIDFDALETVIKKETQFDLNFDSVGWHSIYKLHHRCVDTFSKGRIFLAGDAAHIHSPAGGQGMNTGLQDAHNLAWKLAFVLKGIANPALLDTYNEERLPFAQSLLNFTDKGFSLMAGGNWWLRNFRKYILLSVIGRIMKFNKPKTLAFKTVSQLFYSYNKSSLSSSNTKEKLTFKEGDRLPCFQPGFLESFKEPVFHLIRISNSEILKNEIEEITKIFPFDIKLVEYKITNKWRKMGVSNDLYILVRPDHHILYIADTLGEPQIKQHLYKYFKVT